MPPPPRKKTFVPGCLVSIGLAVLSFVALVVVFVLAVSKQEDEEAFRRVAVPSGGEVVLEESGRYAVHYEAQDFLPSGVCREDSRGGENGSLPTIVIECDEDILVEAGGLAITAAEGELAEGEDVKLAPAENPIDERSRVEVWEIQVDEPGTYRVEMADPPAGTHTVAFERVRDAPAATVVVLIAVPLLFLAAVAVGIVTLVRALGRRGRAQPPGPPPIDWAPPVGPPVAGPT